MAMYVRNYLEDLLSKLDNIMDNVRIEGLVQSEYQFILREIFYVLGSNIGFLATNSMKIVDCDLQMLMKIRDKLNNYYCELCL